MGIFGNKKHEQQGRAPQRSIRGGNENPRYSYYQKRAEMEGDGPRTVQREETPPKKPSRVIHNIPAIIATIVIVLSLGYMTMLSGGAKLKIVGDDSPGAALLQDPAVYEEASSRIVSNSPLNRSKFLVDSNSLARKLEQEFPELSGVTVVMPIIGNKPTFVVKPIHPSFILSSGSGSYVINEFGVAVANVNELKNASSLKLPIVVDKSDLPVERNKAALSGEQTAFINTVIAQLNEKNIPIANFTIPVSAHDVELKIPDKPYFVRFNMLEDPRQQVGSFLAVKKEIDSGKLNAKEYIDVRVEDRVYLN